MKSPVSLFAKTLVSRHARKALVFALKNSARDADPVERLRDKDGNIRVVSYVYQRGAPANLGDDMQTIATERAVKKVLDGKVVFIPWMRDELSRFQLDDGGSALAVTQAYYSGNGGFDFMPSENVVPVWVGTHFSFGLQCRIGNLIKHFPHLFPWHDIGCRDKGTYEFASMHGKNAYFSRCLTLTLPRREPAPTQTKIFCVGLSGETKALLSPEIAAKAEFVDQQNYGFPSVERHRKAAEELLERYRNEAALIVTSALHCAQPCLASGIPVVFIQKTELYDEKVDRMTAFDGLIPRWSLDDLREKRVNWNPAPIDIESLKTDMLLNLKLSIDKALRKPVDEAELAAVRGRIRDFSVK